MSEQSRIALVTGATQGLGRALVDALARRLDAGEVVYLTGRDDGRTRAAAEELAAGSRATVVPQQLDVADPDSVLAFSDLVRQRHGGIDIVFSNAVMRVDPADDVRTVVDEYVAVNNRGTTRLLRALGPLLRDGARYIVVASSLGTLDYLAPVLHSRFRDLATLDEVDHAVDAWREGVRSGAVVGSAWPAFINIPSKIGQVAAVRAIAAQRRDADTTAGVLIAAVCPGMMNTPTSAAFWNVSNAPTPADAAVPLMDLALGPYDPALYGQLSRAGTVLRWDPLAR